MVVEDEELLPNISRKPCKIWDIQSFNSFFMCQGYKKVKDKSQDLVRMDIVFKGEMDGIETGMQMTEIKTINNLNIKYLRFMYY